ncbi:hypothetical protein CUMW_182340 [Citrus unshiu]|nr:SLF3 protein [Citrus maxima]GAY57815.1 hypothetical protein CUMW_182340 [Citrus unshiu]
MERVTTVITGYEDLSYDVMVETLSRLPVKSLMRFRCVCKPWYNLVKDPNFIYKHLKRDNNMRLMIYCTYKNPYDTDPFNDLITYFSIFPDKMLTDLHMQDLEPTMKGNTTGPYDGIFILSEDNTHINLWNVSMDEYRVVPGYKVRLPSDTRAHSSDYGLGVDPVTNDFKLVLVLTLWDENRQWTYNEFSPAAVYNFTTNCWRDLGGCPMSHHYRFEGADDVYLNGFCYWVVRRPDYYKELLTFSMSDEVFQVIEGPNVAQFLNYNESAMRPWMLGLYEDCLSLLYSEEMAHSFDLWTMKGGSWTKQFTFGPFLDTYQPLTFWRKGEFLLQSSDRRLFLFDSKYEEMRDLGVTGLWFSVNILKESLITVKEEDT